MAQSGLILVPLLLLSIATYVHGSAITCSRSANKEYTGKCTTASSEDFSHDGQVELLVNYEARALSCRRYCQRFCEDQKSPSTDWTNCKAFTSLVSKNGGRCQCWGWNHKPNFESGWSDDYRSGWCTA